MTDRELLRLSAIACEELIDEWKNNEAFFDGVLSRWNPLEDSGDALRLATYLRFAIKITDHAIEIFAMDGKCLTSLLVFSQDIESVSGTVRRAIVLAAAFIGGSGEDITDTLNYLQEKSIEQEAIKYLAEESEMY